MRREGVVPVAPDSARLGVGPVAGTGVVIHAMSGIFAVETPEGVLLCRPRGRLRPKAAGAWRDVRDAERTDAALLTGEEQEGRADGEAEAGADLGAPSADAPGPVRRAGQSSPRGGRAARLSGGGGDGQQGAPPGNSGRGIGARRGTARWGVRNTGPEPEEWVPAVAAGDRVRYSRLPDGEGAIDEVLPRCSLLLRPPVANADHVVVVSAWVAPLFSAAFVDRVLLEAALQGCGATVVCNKADLLDPARRAEADAALRPYRAAGYAALPVSAVSGMGLAELRGVLAGRLTVLAGPSGTGKSRLLGALVPDRPRLSAEISARIGRGRHTTRSVELLPLPEGGWVADTPGFSRLDLREAEPEDLPYLYPEFRPYLDRCRYRGCSHGTEPDCAVRAAVAVAEVDAGRYARYLQLVGEMRARRRGRG